MLTPGLNQSSKISVKCHKSRRGMEISRCRCQERQIESHLAIKISLEYASPRNLLASREGWGGGGGRRKGSGPGAPPP